MRVVSLDNALKRRAQLILQAIADRSTPKSNPYIGDHFKGYKSDEELVGELSKLDEPFNTLFCNYKRKKDVNNPSQPTLHFYDFKMVSVEELKRSEPYILQDNIEEKHLYHIDLPAGITHSETIEHEFQKTVSFSEAAQRAWELAAKTSLALEFSAVKASVEISGKYGEQYNQSHSESTTQTDKRSETFSYTGPITADIQAYRSRRKEKVLVDAVCNFDFSISLDPGGNWPGIIFWKSFRTDFLPTIRRTNTNDVMYYHEFMNNPMSDEEIEEIEKASDKIVEFPVIYDEVITESLEPLHPDIKVIDK